MVNTKQVVQRLPEIEEGMCKIHRGGWRCHLVADHMSPMCKPLVLSPSNTNNNKTKPLPFGFNIQDHLLVLTLINFLRPEKVNFFCFCEYSCCGQKQIFGEHYHALQKCLFSLAFPILCQLLPCLTNGFPMQVILTLLPPQSSKY